jgi:hypothetical protein
MFWYCLFGCCYSPLTTHADVGAASADLTGGSVGDYIKVHYLSSSSTWFVTSGFGAWL